MAACDEYTLNDPRFFFALNLLVTLTTYTSADIHMHIISIQWIITEFLRCASHHIYWGYKTDAPCHNYATMCYTFMFKNKNETENLRVTDWSRLSKLPTSWGPRTDSNFRLWLQLLFLLWFSISQQVPICSYLWVVWPRLTNNLLGKDFYLKNVGLFLSD